VWSSLGLNTERCLRVWPNPSIDMCVSETFEINESELNRRSQIIRLRRNVASLTFRRIRFLLIKSAEDVLTIYGKWYLVLVYDFCGQ
jgi:hypothetical protein